jgi:N-methylhydantoinase B/oxoprolinase/acetone carboxylase alpha subunit
VTAEIEPVQPSKKTLFAVLAVVGVIVVATVVGILLNSGGKRIRYEVETTSDSVRMIGYNDDGNQLRRVPKALEDTVDTPWSTTVKFTGTNQTAAVAVDDPAGPATCRIFYNNRKVAEFTGPRGALCEAKIP